MYAVRLDEERVIKWMALFMVLGLLAMAVMPVLQTPEIRAVATVYTGNPYFATVGALIGVDMIKLTPEIVETLLLFGIVG